MADTIVDDRAVFTGFDSLTYAPRGIEITLPNSSEKHYIPDVLEELKPKVGMTFDNMDQAFAYYCNYAAASGFGVRKEDMHFLASSRKLTQLQKHMIQSMAKINIGPVRAFNVMRTIFGGFEEVGVSKNDCKNFKREINLFINEYDAEMMVGNLMKKKEHLPDFSCEYFTDEENCLVGLFWSDGESKRNYQVFGDIMSFDATYRSNRYSMVFVPFTGIDNHNNNVSFGAALLASETTETYKWLLRCFLKAFVKQPDVVVTDQDPAMKKAIEDVFSGSRHRLCMWHVMHKLSTKVGVTLCNTTDFKQRICDIVWTDSLSPSEFEVGWHSVIQDFDLSDNNWLGDIYDMRESWIPAYYRDELMSGLMRTTSRSESENHFFGQVCNVRSTLLEFLTHFETAIESQRHNQRKNDHDTRYTRPQLKTDFVLEKQASQIYTKTLFLDVQVEIVGIEKCINVKLENIDGFTKFFIKDFDQLCNSYFEVMYRPEDTTIHCSCRRASELNGTCKYNKRPVRVPVGYKSKGSGVHNKRIKSKQEEAIVKAGKKSRQCQNCKEYGHYASTCSKPPKKTGVNTKEKTFDTMSADS
ncbi:hypothetical protein QVD17_00200 [Tagetes erecta]|uniref:MULE transposase domain-containing protein n=1 Tax=Tagetes erecta TaxID=13708 RepID=A0AAD8L9Q9_TARER|nr:hypothetical protein QVD17_00200 [Tagetes erecta]